MHKLWILCCQKEGFSPALDRECAQLEFSVCIIAAASLSLHSLTLNQPRIVKPVVENVYVSDGVLGWCVCPLPMLRVAGDNYLGTRDCPSPALDPPHDGLAWLTFSTGDMLTEECPVLLNLISSKWLSTHHVMTLKLIFFVLRVQLNENRFLKGGHPTRLVLVLVVVTGSYSILAPFTISRVGIYIHVPFRNQENKCHTACYMAWGSCQPGHMQLIFQKISPQEWLVWGTFMHCWCTGLRVKRQMERVSVCLERQAGGWLLLIWRGQGEDTLRLLLCPLAAHSALGQTQGSWC